MDSSHAIEHGTSGTGRWLRARRNRFSFWIAAAEAIVVAVLHGVSEWTVIALAALAVAIYWFWGRSTRSDTARQLSWIFAASQALAFVAAVLAVVIGTLVLIVAGIFAAVALFILFTDRR
jgi:hypothetical protein